MFSWHINGVAGTCSVRHPGLIGRLVLFDPVGGITEEDAGWMADVAERMRRIIDGQARPNDMRGARPGR